MTYEKLYQTAVKLVDKATHRTPERHGWHHTKRMRGEETRLRDAVESSKSLKLERRRELLADASDGKDWGKRWEQKLTPSPLQHSRLQTPHVPSLEKQTFSVKDEVIETECAEEDQTMGYPLGTFVETRRNTIVTHGVVVGEEFYSGRAYCTCLVSTGEIWTPNVQDVFFSIPSLVPADLVTRCGAEELTDNKSELNARVETLRRIRLVERALEDTYNVVCSRAHTLYEHLRDPDPEKWGTTTVAEAVKLIDKNPSLTMTFATHKYLMNNPARFIADLDYRTSQRFRVVPLSHMKDLETVEEWMRITKTGPLDSFAEKARGIMAQNAKRFQDSFADPPSGQPAQHAWDENDQLILRFMARALRSTRSNQGDPYAVPQSAILKLLDPKSPTVGDGELHKALIGLGVLAPWQDVLAIQPQLDLDLEPEHRSQRVKEREEMAQRGLEKIQQGAATTRIQGPLGPEDFYPTDPLESVRHDFGDMKVYIIDDAGAHELDDGISIERIPSEPGRTWLHVHIADPASVIPPSHALAIEARKRQESIYFYTRTWPLFPRSLMHSPTHGLSLGSKQAQGIPDRVLTFSAKLDEHGSILDYKVRAGLVRNIKVVDYDVVDRVLGVQFERRYPFGRLASTGEQSETSLTEDEMQNLRDLHAFAKVAIRERGKGDRFQIITEKCLVNGLQHSIPKDLPMRPTFEPFGFSGFPLMEYQVSRGDGSETGSRCVIAEAAKLASRLASRFALDNGNIPLLRRHVPPFVANTPEDHQRLMDAKDPDGFVENWVAAKYISLNPSSVYTLLPKEHFGVGIPEGEGYVRATSPLRRYLDLMTHWQLHHILLGNRAVSRKPPFSEHDMEAYKQEVSGFDRLKKTMQTLHGKYWSLLFIQRWLQGVELGKIDPDKVAGGDPMKRLQGRTLDHAKLNMETWKYQAEIHVPLLGMRGLVEIASDGAREVEIGTLLDLRLKSLRVGIRPLITLEVKT